MIMVIGLLIGLGVFGIIGMIFMVRNRRRKIEQGIKVFTLFRRSIQCPLCDKFYIVRRLAQNVKCPFCVK